MLCGAGLRGAEDARGGRAVPPSAACGAEPRRAGGVGAVCVWHPRTLEHLPEWGSASPARISQHVRQVLPGQGACIANFYLIFR